MEKIWRDKKKMVRRKKNQVFEAKKDEEKKGFKKYILNVKVLILPF